MNRFYPGLWPLDSSHPHEHRGNDSLVLRQFCRPALHEAPDDTTLLRWANLIQPATLPALNDRVIVLAQTYRVTRGRKLCLDGTVVETNIHDPSDSSLVRDGVRVLCRMLGYARVLVPAQRRARPADTGTTTAGWPTAGLRPCPVGQAPAWGSG